ncbi:60S ribosomal protein L18a-like protein [Linum grandiflorum]
MVEQNSNNTTIAHGGGHNPPPLEFPPPLPPSAPISPPLPQQQQQSPPQPPPQSNGTTNQCVDGSPAIGYPYNPHQQYHTSEQQSSSTVTANVYMNSATAIPMPMSTVTVIEGPPNLPCCGIGLGWFLFILGFFFGLPWYIGAGALLCSKYDRREKPGYIACAVLAVIFTILIIISSTRSGGSSSY